MSEETIATVEAVFSKESPFASAWSDGLDEEITFSLSAHHNVWKEDKPPLTGQQVVLGDLRKNDKGWRAHNARFLRPSDEKKRKVKKS